MLCGPACMGCPGDAPGLRLWIIVGERVGHLHSGSKCLERQTLLWHAQDARAAVGAVR